MSVKPTESLEVRLARDDEQLDAVFRLRHEV
jgi:hypothetical protein